MQEAMAIQRLLTIKHAVKLEIIGMKRKGRSAYALAKQKYNLRGNRESVYTQLCELGEMAKAGSYVPPQ